PLPSTICRSRSATPRSASRMRSKSWSRRAASPPIASRRSDGSHFSDTEDQELFVLAGIFESIAGLLQKIWNIDAGQRVGAFDNQYIAGLRLAQRFAGA